ncbi:MAG: hypothetical protein ABSA46_04505 [Thermodesulfovibrionales bacterium]
MSSIDQVSLTTGMQANLIALQNTQALINTTQQALSTGKSVNSALDNPVDYFEAQSLDSTASDLASYGDGMSNAIQTIQAANQGVSSITSLINAAKGIAASAGNAVSSTTSSGNTYQTDTLTFNNMKSGDSITIAGSTFTAVDATTAAIGATQFRVGTDDAQTAQNFVATVGVALGASATTIGVSTDQINVQGLQGTAVTLSSGATDITSALVTASNSVNQAFTPGTGTGNQYASDAVTFSNVKAGDSITIAGSTFTAVAATTATIGATQFRVGTDDAQTAQNFVATVGVAMGATGTTIGITTDQINVSAANGNVVTLTSGATDLTSSLVTASSSMNGTIIPAGSSTNSQLTNLVSQYNGILSQIDGMAADSSFMGVSLLDNTSASALVVNFGNNHSLSIAGFDATSSGLGLSQAQDGWTSSTAINNDTTKLNTALATLQSQSTTLSTNLSTIQARQSFSTQMQNVLTTGADNLTLADTNEEGANMLMLQTQQSLGTTALSLASQSAQSVLRLFS